MNTTPTCEEEAPEDAAVDLPWRESTFTRVAPPPEKRRPTRSAVLPLIVFLGLGALALIVLLTFHDSGLERTHEPQVHIHREQQAGPPPCPPGQYAHATSTYGWVFVAKDASTTPSGTTPMNPGIFPAAGFIVTWPDYHIETRLPKC